jgi:hypothetical protein
MIVHRDASFDFIFVKSCIIKFDYQLRHFSVATIGKIIHFQQSLTRIVGLIHFILFKFACVIHIKKPTFYNMTLEFKADSRPSIKT